jgi:hypothetical protein
MRQFAESLSKSADWLYGIQSTIAVLQGSGFQ